MSAEWTRICNLTDIPVLGSRLAISPPPSLPEHMILTPFAPLSSADCTAFFIALL